MSTATESKSANPRSAGTQPPAAVLFELEGVALPARQVLFEAARKHLAGHGVKLGAAPFSRCAGSITTLASQLASAYSLTGESDELAEALNKALADHFAQHAKIIAGLDKLLKVAEQRELPAAALTSLPEPVAQAVFAAAGLEARGVQLFVFSDTDKVFPRADAWLKAAKQLGKTPRFCVAVGSSNAACKSALSAGMRAVAVPDAYTGHHDFGGADIVIDSWEDVSASELLDTLVPPLR